MGKFGAEGLCHDCPAGKMPDRETDPYEHTRHTYSQRIGLSHVDDTIDLQRNTTCVTCAVGMSWGVSTRRYCQIGRSPQYLEEA
jgi:hypothetical protein